MNDLVGIFRLNYLEILITSTIFFRQVNYGTKSNGQQNNFEIFKLKFESNNDENHPDHRNDEQNKCPTRETFAKRNE